MTATYVPATYVPATYVPATDGVALAVYDHGTALPRDAPTIICVHGYPDNSSVWDGVVAELRADYRVVTYDVRGAGASGAPMGRAGYRMDQLAEDLMSVVAMVSPTRPVHLLAHDWGSIQTWHSVTGPALAGRVASFTSVSGPSLDHAGRWMRAGFQHPTWRGLRAVLGQLVHSAYIGFFQLPLLPELACRSGLLDRMIGGDRRPLADKVNGLELYRANMLARLGSPTEQRTDVPVQVLAPTHDSYVTAALQTEAPVPWVSDLQTRSITGGHWVLSSRPDAVAQWTRELVDRVEGAALQS